MITILTKKEAKVLTHIAVKNPHGGYDAYPENYITNLFYMSHHKEFDRLQDAGMIKVANISKDSWVAFVTEYGYGCLEDSKVDRVGQIVVMSLIALPLLSLLVLCMLLINRATARKVFRSQIEFMVYQTTIKTPEMFPWIYWLLWIVWVDIQLFELAKFII